MLVKGWNVEATRAQVARLCSRSISSGSIARSRTLISPLGGYFRERVVVAGDAQHYALALSFRHLASQLAGFCRTPAPMVGIAR